MSADGTTPDWLRGSAALVRAHALASEAHSGQAGKDGHSPYIGHPLAVAERLAADGLDERTVTAAILHDVVERSDLSNDEVVARFGVDVGELVSALTDDATIEPYAERKREHRERVAEAGPRAAAIYAADKLTNLRELGGLYAELGEAAGGRLPVSIDDRVGSGARTWSCSSDWLAILRSSASCATSWTASRRAALVLAVTPT